MSGTTNIPAACVIFRKDDKFLFVLRSQTGFMDGKYTLPAGHVEDNESFKMAAVREAYEETGLVIRPDQLKHVHTQHTHNHDTPDRIHMFFEADDWIGTPKNMEPTIHGEIRWFKADDLPYGQIMDLVAEGLRQIAAGEPYGEYGWNVQEH